MGGMAREDNDLGCFDARQVRLPAEDGAGVDAVADGLTLAGFPLRASA